MNANSQQRVIVGEQSLELFCGCLGFDFIGTNPDESAEDVGTIQVPAAWRDIVQEPSTIELLMFFYRSTQPPVSNVAMKALVHLSSVRRSIFLTDPDRMAFLSSIMTCIRDILKGGVGLEVCILFYVSLFPSLPLLPFSIILKIRLPHFNFYIFLDFIYE
jgi:exportin-7